MVYTCDDLQSWVPWKYVDVARNLKWIKKVISDLNYSPRSQIPFGVENRIDSPENVHGNYKDFKDYNYKDETDAQVDYKISPYFDHTRERMKKDQEQSLKAMDPKDFLRSMNNKLNNRPFAKEIPPMQEMIFPQSSDYSLVSQNLFSGQNLWGKVDDKSPRIAVNKCFLNGDGTVVCQNHSTLPGN